MKVLVVVDHSDCAERVVARMGELHGDEPRVVQLCMVVNPYLMVPAASVLEPAERLIFRIRHQGFQRLAELAEVAGKSTNSVEIEMLETRVPESVAVLMQAAKWKADQLVVGTHQVLGIKKLILRACFGWLRRVRNGRRVHKTGDRSNSGTTLIGPRAA